MSSINRKIIRKTINKIVHMSHDKHLHNFHKSFMLIFYNNGHCMQTGYSDYILNIIYNHPKLSKTKKEILSILLTDWINSKIGVTAAELQEYLQKASVIYKHIEDLAQMNLITLSPGKSPFKISINIQGIEELERLRNEQQNLKATILSARKNKS